MQRTYERTPQGFLMRAYANMRQRVNGQQAKKAHLYKGLPILTRQQFYEWAWDNPEFWRLYKRWVGFDYNQRLTPSVSRIEASKGYAVDNMVWLTHSANSALGNKSPSRNAQSQQFLEVFNYARTAT